MSDDKPQPIKCFDQNIHRWYCQRTGDVTCPLVKCIEAGANRHEANA